MPTIAPFTTFRSKVLPLPQVNIDTDQLTPARFLKQSRPAGGYGEILLYDWRFDADGNPRPDCVLNLPQLADATIVLAGENFGCGSSRETAVWALAEYGIRAVISTSYGDIFRNNALKNGLLPIVVDAATAQRLFALLAAQPGTELEVDLESQTLRLPEGETIYFPFDAFYRECLLQGLDQLGYMLARIPEIEAFERARPPAVDTTAAEA